MESGEVVWLRFVTQVIPTPDWESLLCMLTLTCGTKKETNNQTKEANDVVASHGFRFDPQES